MDSMFDIDSVSASRASATFPSFIPLVSGSFVTHNAVTPCTSNISTPILINETSPVIKNGLRNPPIRATPFAAE